MKIHKRHWAWYLFQGMFTVLFVWSGIIHLLEGELKQIALSILGLVFTQVTFSAFRHYDDTANQHYD